VTVRAARLQYQTPKVSLTAGPRRKRKTRRTTQSPHLNQRRHGHMIPGSSCLMTNSLRRLAACRAEHWASFHPLAESPSRTLMHQHPEHPSISHARPRPQIHSLALPRNPFDLAPQAICHPPQPIVVKEVHQAKHGVCTAREASVQWAEMCEALGRRRMG
jgi:hypothetical protein